MSKLITLKLTEAELHMIEYWLEKNLNEGWYMGNEEQYFNRMAKLKDKLNGN